MNDTALNYFDNITIDRNSFAYNDIIGQDVWRSFTPVFGSLTVVGATSYTGRYRIVGKQMQGQVSFSAATSVASTAGTDYLTLPKTANGISGFGVMTNDTTNIAVGLCHLDVSTSRLYLPTQAASGNTFNLYFEYEV
jgi:hypothetical protein